MSTPKPTTFSLAVTEAGLTHAALEAAKAALAAVALDDNGYPISQDTREKVWTAAQAVREALKAREAFSAKAKADLAEAEALEEPAAQTGRILPPPGVQFLRDPDPKHEVHHTDGSWAAYGGPDGWTPTPVPGAPAFGNPAAGWVEGDTRDTWAPIPEAPTDADHDTPEMPKDPTDVPHDDRPSWD